MATIKSQLSLNDGMSSVLKKINNALSLTLDSFEQVQRASGKAINTANISEARAGLVDANREIEQMEEGFRQAAEEEKKLNSSIKAGTNAADGLLKKVASIAATYMSLSAIKGLLTDSLEAADIQLSAQVQLNTVMGNMGTLDYYDKVLTKASEIQSKGIYGDEAMIAGAAELSTYFTDGEAILSMMDTLSNYAMGMSGGGELDPTAMVDYATGIGKIMTGSYDAMTKKGFEFSDAQKAIIEGTATNAQIVEELGEEYVGLSNDMQAAAVIGAVIDEGWAGLYETMSATPEGQIISFKNALGDIKEEIGAGIYPAVLNFMTVFRENLPQIHELALGFAGVISKIITHLTDAANMALQFASVIQDNWSWIEPLVMGIVTALLLYHGALVAINIVTGIKSTLEAIAAASAAFHAGKTLEEAAATTTATGAQVGLNAALLACPLTWIILLIIAVIAVIMAVCSWIAKTTGIAQTGFGVITGGLNVAVQAVKNAALVVANVGLGIWEVLKACCSNIGTAFHNVIASVQGWFYGLLATALNVVEGICAALNKLPFVEFDYSGISNKADEYARKSQEAYDSKGEYESLGEAFSRGFNTYDTFTDGWASDAYKSGAAWGDGIADKVGGLFDSGSGIGNIDALTQEALGNGGALNGMANDVGDIADNTASAADSKSITEEQLKYLHDIAERDAINRFTTAEVSIDMTGMTNKIDSAEDLDGVIAKLTDGFTEALLTAAEGVHA